MEAPDGVTAIETRTGAAPVPLTDIFCGLLGPSSVTLIVPFRVPVACGVNVIKIEQVAPAATVAGLSGQFVVLVKSDKLD
jgi:hypothetical protein